MAGAATAAHKAHEGMTLIKLEKADKRVNYRIASEGDAACGGCRFFCEAGLHCNMVEGSIDPEWTCNMYTKPLSAAPSYDMSHYGYGENVQIFTDASQVFKSDTDFSKPMWIPFMPTPGDYKHPVYGMIEITKETNEEFVQSVKDKVYQENIPMDAEHETKLSGAVGWLSDMRLNEDGSADAYVEWTDRGQSLLQSGNFKYISPEWFDQWRDPATEVVHFNVIAGGAITTRPFFKDKVLRALVASEEGGELIAPDKNRGDHRMADKDPKDTSITMTEAQLDDKIAAAAKKASEEAVAAAEVKFGEQLAERDAKILAAETLAGTEKEAREAATNKLIENEKADRVKRFKDMIAGRGGENDGAPWIGDADNHLAVLTAMAESLTEGEANEVFVKHIENQNSVAAQAKESHLFETVGTAGSGAAGGSPEAKLDALAKARATSENIPYERAYTQVLATEEGKRLYSERSAAPIKGVSV